MYIYGVRGLRSNSKSSFKMLKMEEQKQAIKIPEQLQNRNLGFVLLGQWNEFRHKQTHQVKIFEPKTKDELEELKLEGWNPLGKAPFETGWQTKPYLYDDPLLIGHIEKGANFGVIGGFGAVRIVDIDDPKHIPYFDSVLGDTYNVITGTGGRHYYVFSDYDTNHVFTAGVGEFRAKNYQVVSAPCMHPLGVRYKPNENSIKTYSKGEILKIIEPFIRTEKKEAISIETTSRDDSRSGLEFREVIKKIREGKTKEDIDSEMKAYSKWSASPPQYRELTYNKALAFVQDKKLNYAQRKDLAQYQQDELTDTDLSDVKLNVYSDEELLTYEPKPQKWLIENVLPDSEIGLLVGKRAERKTFTALHLLLSLGFGKACFGVEKVPEKKKVLFVSEEDSLDTIANRIKILKKGMGLEKEFAEIKYISFSGLKLDRRDKKFLLFEDLVKNFKPDLIIVDALQRCVTFEVDKDNQKISQFFTETVRPMQMDLGCSWLFIHHLRKSPTGKSFVSDEMDEVRGGSELTNYCRFVLLCKKPKSQKQEGEMILFEVLKMNNSFIPASKVISFTTEGDALKVAYEGEPEEILSGAQLCAEAIKNYLFDYGIYEFRTKDIHEKSDEIGFKKTLIEQGLSALVSDGFLERVKRGQYKVKGANISQQKLKEPPVKDKESSCGREFEEDGQKFYCGTLWKDNKRKYCPDCQSKMSLDISQLKNKIKETLENG